MSGWNTQNHPKTHKEVDDHKPEKIATKELHRLLKQRRNELERKYERRISICNGGGDGDLETAVVKT